jgi:hypothetical protein
MRKAIFLLLFAATASAPAYADSPYGITASVGTTGLGVHLSTRVAQDLNARLGVNFLNYSGSASTQHVDYDLKLKMGSLDALLDYFVAQGEFRISGGLVYNRNKVTATGKPNATGTFTLNGQQFSTAQLGTLNGEIDFKKIAPYLGIGWGNSLRKDRGWGFSGDLGVLFQGSPRTTLTSSTNCLGDPVCQASLAAENQSLNDKVHNFKAFPVVRVGATYRF